MNVLRPQTDLFIATSLNGLIARLDGCLDWLTEAQGAAPADEDFGYARFMPGIDTLLVVRKTFETVPAFEPWFYEGNRVHAMSRRAGWRVDHAS